MANKILLFFNLAALSIVLAVCTPASIENSSESPVVNLSKNFTEVSKLNFNEAQFAAHRPSKMIVKGVFGARKEFIALLDYQVQRFIVINKVDNSIEYTFELPPKAGCGNMQVLEVISMDSVLYLDEERQEMLIYNADGFKRAWSFDVLKKKQHELMKITPFSEFLRSIDGYIGFTNWIAYGAGGENLNYDSLMDQRNMVSFFKIQGDSMISRDIPIKPYLLRNQFPNVRYNDNPYFEINKRTNDVIVFHTSADTIYTYNWDNKKLNKHVISGSSVQLIPPKIPRRGSAIEIFLMADQQEWGHHRIYYDYDSGKYIRYLNMKFPKSSVDGIPTRPDIRILQLLNEDFEVEAEMDFPEEYGFPARVNGSVYLRKFDDEKRELTIYKFEMPTTTLAEVGAAN